MTKSFYHKNIFANSIDNDKSKKIKYLTSYNLNILFLNSTVFHIQISYSI